MAGLVEKENFIPGTLQEYDGLCLFIVTPTNLNTSCIMICQHRDHIGEGLGKAYLLCR
jgi:hypothetical protein